MTQSAPSAPPSPRRAPLPFSGMGGPQDCPMARALDQISGRWKPRLLHRLMIGEAQFLDLLCDFPTMNRKVLAEQLRALVRDGLVCRAPQGDARKTVRYGLTPDGLGLMPALAALFDWAQNRQMPPPVG